MASRWAPRRAFWTKHARRVADIAATDPAALLDPLADQRGVAFVRGVGVPAVNLGQHRLESRQLDGRSPQALGLLGREDHVNLTPCGRRQRGVQLIETAATQGQLREIKTIAGRHRHVVCGEPIEPAISAGTRHAMQQAPRDLSLHRAQRAL